MGLISENIGRSHFTSIHETVINAVLPPRSWAAIDTTQVGDLASSNQDQTAVIALSLVPLCLIVIGLGAVLNDDFRPGGILDRSAFVAAGILGELLLLVRRLDNLAQHPSGAVTLVFPWAVFFSTWIVLQHLSLSRPPWGDLVWSIGLGAWLLVVVVDFALTRGWGRKHRPLRAINCLSPPNGGGEASDARIGGSLLGHGARGLTPRQRRSPDDFSEEEEWLKLLIQAILMGALGVMACSLLVGGRFMPPALLSALGAAAKINYLATGLVVCGWDIFGWIRHHTFQ